MEIGKGYGKSISFVVSVFNMEKYLSACLESIIEQNVNDAEIILVDDGSTDSSAALCDQYAQKYEFIKAIHKENGGISSARNVGLMAANGEYVCFVDSDDYFKCDFAKRFLKICREEKLDIIRGWYGIYDEEVKGYTDHFYPNISFSNQTVSGADFLIKSVLEHANEVVPWLGFFRRDYLLNHGLSFPEGIAYEEDQLFFLEALICDKDCRAYQSDIEFYAYRKRAGSATKSPKLKQIKDILFVVREETKLIDKYSLTGELRRAAYKYICASFYQLTSIYGRLPEGQAKEAAKMVPFWMKWQCICHPYDRHKLIKIFLFTFARWFVDVVYKRRQK